MPGIPNDADLEMMELEEIANGLAEARKHGVCPHESASGRVTLVCTECGQVFQSEQDWLDAHDDVRSTWT